MASNLSNQSRNVLSKKVMVKKEVIYTLQIRMLNDNLLLFHDFIFWIDPQTKILCIQQDAIDNITLFSIITIMSFILAAPLTLIMEGVKFTPAYIQSTVSI